MYPNYDPKHPDTGAFENWLLYRMCWEFPKHDCPSVTAGKITAIGRIYSANPARGAGKPKTKYEETSLYLCIANKLLNGNFDKMLDEADERKDIPAIVDQLIEHIQRATEEWSETKFAPQKNAKQPRKHVSFASKYLHFHKPDHFPIYDRYSRLGLSCHSRDRKISPVIFNSYRPFYDRLLEYQKECNAAQSSFRDIDNQLVKIGKQHSKQTDKKCQCGWKNK